MNLIRNIQNVEPYVWGDNCLGWHLLASAELSVIQEEMPPHTAEQAHYHEKAQQLFYILSGVATFYIAEEKTLLKAGDAIQIAPKTIHQVQNDEAHMPLKFLVISQPKAHGDRINL